MYSIIVCEDDSLQLEMLKDFIEKFILFHNEFSLLLGTQYPQGVLAFLKKNKVSKGIYVLDVNLNCEMTGIDLAEKIRVLDPQAKLIFITTHEELAPLTLSRRVEALDYVLKKNSKEEIRSCLIENLLLAKERLVNLQECKEKNLSFSVGKILYNVDIEDVFFLEPSKLSHKLTLYTKKGQYEFYGSLNEYQERHCELYRASKKSLVNLKNVLKVDFASRKIIFSGELFCRYSVGQVKKLKKLLAN